MADQDLNENFSKLANQTRDGHVDNETAMRVYAEAYKMLPRGGSVEHYDEEFSYSNGLTMRYGTHRDKNGLWLNSELSLSGPNSDKCPANKDELQKTYDCLRENQTSFGGLIKTQRQTEFSDGTKSEYFKSASHSMLWKSPVTDKEVSKYSRELGDISVSRVEENGFDRLSVSRKVLDGVREEFRFVRPDVFRAASVRYEGLFYTNADNAVTAQRKMIRIIGTGEKNVNSAF